MKRYAVLLALVLTGCATHQVPPPSVQVMPTDCANRVSIVNWLESQARHPRQSFESQQHYEQNRAEIRSRIWHLRYRCQPV